VTNASSADTDLEGLRRHLEDGASMPYVDVDKQQRFKRAVQRWPLLARLRALTSAASTASTAGGRHD